MGGRGASSGISKKGNVYGSQYHTLLKSGNIKFVKANSKESEPLLETMTKGRVYALIDNNNNIKNIIYFDNENKRNKRIDLDHYHKKMKPHTQKGYYGNEYDLNNKKGASKLSTKEIKMVDRIYDLWYK